MLPTVPKRGDFLQQRRVGRGTNRISHLIDSDSRRRSISTTELAVSTPLSPNVLVQTIRAGPFGPVGVEVRQFGFVVRFPGSDTSSVPASVMTIVTATMAAALRKHITTVATGVPPSVRLTTGVSGTVEIGNGSGDAGIVPGITVVFASNGAELEPGGRCSPREHYSTRGNLGDRNGEDLSQKSILFELAGNNYALQRRSSSRRGRFPGRYSPPACPRFRC